MARFILLDAGPLGLACSRPGTTEVDQCRAWLAHIETSTADAVIPAIADYEVRRELIRLSATAKIRRLDALRGRFGCVPIELSAFDRAAEFWALIRRGGMPTATDEALDVDAGSARHHRRYNMQHHIL